MKDNSNDKEIYLPKNIRQMGNIDDSIKIYMEDYVFTYLQQYANQSKGKEQIAFLVGKGYMIDGIYTIFISGAIKGDETYEENGIIKFSEKSFDSAKANIDKYFSECSIVGWFYSQPGFSDYINEEYIKYHRDVFNDTTDVFFLSDPVENIGGFYRLKDGRLDTVKGFIIYYEKNEQMGEYMIDNKKNINKDEEKRYKEKDEKLVKLSREAKIKKTPDIQEQKKLSSVFSSLSAVLFLVCFIMGMGLIQSEDKISQLEKRITKLDESYRYVLSSMKNESVQSVFATSNEKLHKTEDTTEANTENTTVDTISTETVTEISTETSTTTVNSTVNSTVDIEKEKKKKNNEEVKKDMKTYKVKSGDSLGSISEKFYGTISMMDSIMEANAIDNADKIYSGMIIKLP